LKGEKIEEELEVNLQLRGGAFIPEEYVQDEKVVLELYRRVESARSDSDFAALKSEIEERFGDVPASVQRLMEEAKLRIIAREAAVPYMGIEHEEGRLIAKLHGWDLKMIDRALRGLPEAKGVRIIDAQTLSFGLSLKAKHDEAALRETVKNILEPLAETRSRYGTSFSPVPDVPAKKPQVFSSKSVK
jgi:transcription-repair coupling factor (superfamily II helicase)